MSVNLNFMILAIFLNFPFSPTYGSDLCPQKKAFNEMYQVYYQDSVKHLDKQSADIHDFIIEFEKKYLNNPSSLRELLTTHLVDISESSLLLESLENLSYLLEQRRESLGKFIKSRGGEPRIQIHNGKTYSSRSQQAKIYHRYNRKLITPEIDNLTYLFQSKLKNEFLLGLTKSLINFDLDSEQDIQTFVKKNQFGIDILELRETLTTRRKFLFFSEDIIRKRYFVTSKLFFQVRWHELATHPYETVPYLELCAQNTNQKKLSFCQSLSLATGLISERAYERNHVLPEAPLSYEDYLRQELSLNEREISRCLLP